MKVAERYYLDANTVIAIVEQAERLNVAQAAFLENVDAGHVLAVSSEIALSECLVKPLRERNETAISSLLSFLDGRPNLQLVRLSRAVMIKAAEIRAATALKLPDAIHIACALEGNAPFS